MKKLIAVCVLSLSVTVAAFADHPGGWGIGVVGGGGIGGGGGALSLKIPSLPIYWAIDFDFGANYFGLNVQGDYYLLDQVLTPLGSVGDLGWYIGLGGYLGLGFFDNKNNYNDDDYTSFNLGVRVPIGLSLQIKPLGPFDALELFLEIAPSLGFRIYKDGGFDSSWFGGVFGLRLWL